MIRLGDISCPFCGGALNKYGKVSRVLKSWYGRKIRLSLQRYICLSCGKTHRELTDQLIPYKQYSSKIIFGFLIGFYTYYDKEFEDYPCDATVQSWKNDLVLFEKT